MMRSAMPWAAVVAVFLLVSMPTRAADFETGVKAYDTGDFAKALAEWLPLARDGDPAAERNIGHMYRLGQGVPLDTREAVKWYRRAADKGLARAQANLGSMYLNGEGVDRDFAQAANWFYLAAIQGHVIAQYNLGQMYELGFGVARDSVRAMAWYNLAAKSGHQKALDRLSILVATAGPPEIASPSRAAAEMPPAPKIDAALADKPTTNPVEAAPSAADAAKPGLLARLLGLGGDSDSESAAVKPAAPAAKTPNEPTRTPALEEDLGQDKVSARRGAPPPALPAAAKPTPRPTPRPTPKEAAEEATARVATAAPPPPPAAQTAAPAAGNPVAAPRQRSFLEALLRGDDKVAGDPGPSETTPVPAAKSAAATTAPAPPSPTVPPSAAPPGAPQAAAPKPEASKPEANAVAAVAPQSQPPAPPTIRAMPPAGRPAPAAPAVAVRALPPLPRIPDPPMPSEKESQLALAGKIAASGDPVSSPPQVAAPSPLSAGSPRPAPALRLRPSIQLPPASSEEEQQRIDAAKLARSGAPEPLTATTPFFNPTVTFAWDTVLKKGPQAERLQSAISRDGDSVAGVPTAETAVALGSNTRLMPAGRDTGLDAVEAGLIAYRARDFASAVSFWLPQAYAGRTRAQFYIGGLYHDGTGVEPDRVQAFVWWSLAAERGYLPAVSARNDLARELSDAERQEGLARIKDWKPTGE